MIHQSSQEKNKLCDLMQSHNNFIKRDLGDIIVQILDNLS